MDESVEMKDWNMLDMRRDMITQFWYSIKLSLDLIPDFVFIHLYESI